MPTISRYIFISLLDDDRGGHRHHQAMVLPHSTAAQRQQNQGLLLLRSTIGKRQVWQENPSQLIVLHLNRTPIEIADQVTDLGIIISSTLNWAEQIRGISNRV